MRDLAVTRWNYEQATEQSYECPHCDNVEYHAVEVSLHECWEKLTGEVVGEYLEYYVVCDVCGQTFTVTENTELKVNAEDCECEDMGHYEE